jgi:hypothetical protein
MPEAFQNVKKKGAMQRSHKGGDPLVTLHRIVNRLILFVEGHGAIPVA